MAVVEENLFEKSQLVLSAEHTNNVVLLVQNLSILSVCNNWCLLQISYQYTDASFIYCSSSHYHGTRETHFIK